MKFLGTITKVNQTGELTLIEFPDDISSIELPTEVKIGFSLNLSTSLKLIGCNITRKKLMINIEGINSYESGKRFLEMGIFIAPENLIFENDDGYYISDIIGCEVYNNNSNEYLGTIYDVYSLPANDVWIVKTLDGELPIPVIDDVIIDVDLEDKKIMINIIPGLMDLIQ